MKIDSRISWLADGYRYKLFEDKSLQSSAIQPSEKDNFLLHPNDDPKIYVEYSIGPQLQEKPPRLNRAFRRIKSASAVRLRDRPWIHPEQPRYPADFIIKCRPSSAITGEVCSSSSVVTPRRIKSANSRRTVAEMKSRKKLNELRMGFTLCNKLYDDVYKSTNVHLHPAGPAPDYRYFDRHARCYCQTHTHRNVLADRSQHTCEKFLEAYGSRTVSPARPDDLNVHPRQYIDYHRPRTAPNTRQELQYVPRPSYVFRGHTPHFCNFVQQMQLHNRPITASDFTGCFDSDLGEDEFIFESKEGMLIKRYRKPSDVRSTSGTEGRPGSPSSQGDDSYQVDDHDHQPVTGVVGTSNVSIPEEDEAGEIFLDDMPLSPWNKVGKTIDFTQLSNSTDNQNYNNNNNNNDRLPSPRQPPPSPEPIKGPRIKEIPLPVTQVKQRGCIKQKTKKPFERVRTMKNTEDTNETPPPATVEDAPNEIPVIENEKINTKLDIKLPDLPSSIEKQKERKKESNKPKRHLIETENDFFSQNNDDLLNEQLQLNRAEFDWLNMDMNGVEDIKRQPQTKSWIAGRLALSQQSSRFELPMDMKNLETMTPQEYIKAHCIITSRRQNLYQKIFLKNKDKTASIPYKDIDRSLKDVLVNTITSEQIQEVLKTLDIDENTKVDYKLFAGMAAFAERVLYPRFVTEDTLDMPEYQREKIECADFSALKWKFEGVHVNPPMAKLLEQIS